MNTFELVVAGVLSVFGLRSLARWMGRSFDSTSMKEQLLYLLHVTARVGMWFAVAAVFAGYALLDEPQRLREYLLLLIALPAVQLLTGFALSRSPTVESGEGVTERASGNGRNHESGEPRTRSAGDGEIGRDVGSRPPTASGG